LRANLEIFKVTAQSKPSPIWAKIGPIWDRCYDFKNIFAEKFGKNQKMSEDVRRCQDEEKVGLSVILIMS
jgi:hypothetical protein